MKDPGLVQSLLDLVVQNANGVGAVVLFGSSLIEYVCPPFPGDVITLFGTWLVVQGYWSFAFALALVTLGSLAGAALDYGIGVLIGRRLDRLPSEREAKALHPLTREKYDLLTLRFRRYGAAYVLVNRFLPGIRAFFLVAAGAARMPFWKVMVFAGVSAVAWNALILFAGYSVGTNWERLHSLFKDYTLLAWCLIGVAVLGAVVSWLVKRVKSRGAAGGKINGREQ